MTRCSPADSKQPGVMQGFFSSGFKCAAVSAALETAGFVAVQAAVMLARVRCQPFTVCAITA